MNSKVIYLNEDTQELTSNKDIEGQFATNEQFTEKVDSSNSGESLASVNNSGGELDILNIDDTSGESNYGIVGGANPQNNKLNNKLNNNEKKYSNNDNFEYNKSKHYNSEQSDSEGGDSEGGDSEGGHSEGGDSEGDGSQYGGSDVSSVNTNQILEMDPMYIRLTKFLQTGGENNKNLADILLDISNNFTKLNENLEKLGNNMTKLSFQ